MQNTNRSLRLTDTPEGYIIKVKFVLRGILHVNECYG